MDLNEKIITAIKKLAISERSLMWEVSAKYHLTPLQIQFLLYIRDHNLKFNTISNLTKEFDIRKSTASEAVKLLMKKGYITKVPNKNDKRVYYLNLTERGETLAQKIDLWKEKINLAIEGLGENEKYEMYIIILKLLKNLYLLGGISIVRMCLTCEYFNNFYCNLLKMDLRAGNLRIDCPEYKPVNV